MTIQWFYPNLATVLGSAQVVVQDPGSEFVIANTTIDIRENYINVANTTTGWLGGSGFNGFVLTDTFGTIPDFTAFSLGSFSGPLGTAPILSFSADQLSVNFNALDTNNIRGGQTNYTFSFSTAAAPVPEPSTMLLLGSGLVGLIGYGRRRLKK